MSDPCASEYSPSWYRWQVIDAYTQATGNLCACLVAAAALCEAYWLGWFARSCEATPGSFNDREYFRPGWKLAQP